MTTNIERLFCELKKTPFPAMGKVIGDFALYDSLLAGSADSFLAGAALKNIPEPDEETAQAISRLKKKQKFSKAESEFLEYAALLERLRSELAKARSHGRTAAEAS